MLKITRIDGGDSGPTLKLEGKLLEPWVSELQRALGESNGRLRGVRLDLAAVTFLDAAGIRMLRKLVRRGISIAACSAFVAELLHEESLRGKS